ncbi:TetR/AcrR family transcriptional regulator [Peteryoungia ipomoeae]|uniref:TetR family transcriptional regulator n=1 Tax=Peteryoungia ipomoeae TaxID=1210932 RepID=A0A4V6T670_9HYPH|nr:TetR family transcriptional regulator [Peteryoungia ipomoeae]THV22906.1 TetR family transcriptional regulator [Peteryoungia ipomoeae]
MSDAHRRQKNPERVRTQLIEAAISHAHLHGLPAISVEMIASAAGVTRGAIFHHFPNKRALIDAVFAEILTGFAADLAAEMAKDPEPYGRFTRAYLELAIRAYDDVTGGALWKSALLDPALTERWRHWLIDEIEAQPPSEKGLSLEVVRFAAEGLWLGAAMGVAPRDREALRTRLLAMTLERTP